MDAAAAHRYPAAGHKYANIDPHCHTSSGHNACPHPHTAGYCCSAHGHTDHFIRAEPHATAAHGHPHDDPNGHGVSHAISSCFARTSVAYPHTTQTGCRVDSHGNSSAAHRHPA